MHHANVIIGSHAWGITCVPMEDRIECLDTSIIISDRLSIADVRTLIDTATLRPLERTYRTFVISTTQILSDAQNALLKLFEEPNLNTVFYVIIPREDILLPTLRSRMHILAREEVHANNTNFDIFLQKGYSERLDMITQKLKNEDSQWVVDIVQGLSRYAHTSHNTELMHDVLMVESHVYANGSAKKMLLEHTALTLPSTV